MPRAVATPEPSPEMSVVSATAPKVGAPEALPCRTVVVVPRLLNTVGADPAPPPRIIALAVNAPEDAHADAELKYGIPPDVPATVRARVPEVVIGEPPTLI